MNNHKQSLEPNEYQCDMCHQVYNKGWSEEEAQQETQQYWPDIAQEDCAVICDDCYQQIQPETIIRFTFPWWNCMLARGGIQGYIDAGTEIFDLIRSDMSPTWSIIKHHLLPSKQTRTFYRVRARAWERRKVVVHAHRRRHRGNKWA